MLKKIYQKLMRKKKTASGGMRPISEKKLSHLIKHAESSEAVVLAGQKPLRREMHWRRVELLTENEQCVKSVLCLETWTNGPS